MHYHNMSIHHSYYYKIKMDLSTARDKYMLRVEYAIFRTMVLIIGLFVTCVFLYD